MGKADAFRRIGKWVRGRGRGRSIAGLLFVVGLGIIGLSILPGASGPDDAWRRDVLMTVGASLALFAPFFLLTRSLERHMDDVESKVEDAKADAAQRIEEVRAEASETSAALTGQVDALRAEVNDKFSEVTERVTARLKHRDLADREAIRALRHSASRHVVLDALRRAHELGLVSDLRPPRVSVSQQADFYASVEFTPGQEWNEDPLRLRLEAQEGVVLEWIEWPEDKPAEDVLVDLGIALRKHTNETFAPAPFLNGLADLLEAALSQADRRAAVQLCPPQWMVCDWGVVRYDGQSTYGVATSRLRKDNGMSTHVAQKAWVDIDSWEQAYAAALALYPEPGPDPWAATSYDEPPL